MNRIVTASLLAVLVFAACSSKDMSIEEFQSLTRDLDHYTAQLEQRRAQLEDLVSSYNQTVPENEQLHLSIPAAASLADTDREALEERIDTEEDGSCCTVLKRAREVDEEMQEIEADLAAVTAQLPKPHVVESGENHYQLSIDFLTASCGLSRGRADSLISRVALNSDIIEGFHVWFVFTDRIFGTYVTQGSASISPTVFSKELRRHQLARAREDGRKEAYTRILDSLKRSGAFLASTPKLR